MDAIIATGPLYAWIDNRPETFPASAHAAIIDSNFEIGVSAASFYELGVYAAEEGIALDLRRAEGLVVSRGFAVIPATARIMTEAISLPTNDQNPFFRIIAATANELKAAVISPDRRFDPIAQFGRLWA